MSRAGYLLAILLFILVVMAGVSVVLTEFNRMIRPAAPVNALNLEAAGNSTYRVEILGEEAGVKLPGDLSPAEEMFKKSHAALVEAMCLMRVKAGHVSDNWRPALQETGKRLFAYGSSVFAAVVQPLQEWLQSLDAGKR